MNVRSLQINLRSLQIIVVGIPIFAGILALIALLLPNGQPQPIAPDVQILRWIHLGLTISGLIASKFLGERILSGKMKTAAAAQPATFFQRYFISIIVRLA